MNYKLISFFALTALALHLPLVAEEDTCNDDSCQPEEPKEEQVFFVENDEQNDEIEDEARFIFASCSGGKCPKAMIDRCRELKRLEREAEENNDEDEEEEEEEPQSSLA